MQIKLEVKSKHLSQESEGLHNNQEGDNARNAMLLQISGVQEFEDGGFAHCSFTANIDY